MNARVAPGFCCFVGGGREEGVQEERRERNAAQQFIELNFFLFLFLASTDI